MSDLQVMFASIGALCAVFGAAWIVSQSLSRSQKIPEYDARFLDVERRIEDMNRQIDALQAWNIEVQKTMAVQTHSLNNQKQRSVGVEFSLKDLRDKIDHMPERIVKLLRGLEGPRPVTLT